MIWQEMKWRVADREEEMWRFQEKNCAEKEEERDDRVAGEWIRALWRDTSLHTDEERTKRQGQWTETQRRAERQMHDREGRDGRRRRQMAERLTRDCCWVKGAEERCADMRWGSDGEEEESQWSGWSHQGGKVLHHRRGHVRRRDFRERVVKESGSALVIYYSLLLCCSGWEPKKDLYSLLFHPHMDLQCVCVYSASRQKSTDVSSSF